MCIWTDWKQVVRMIPKNIYEFHLQLNKKLDSWRGKYISLTHFIQLEPLIHELIFVFNLNPQ